MTMCPNGRYILTAGNKGDIILWSITKKNTIPVDAID